MGSFIEIVLTRVVWVVLGFGILAASTAYFASKQNTGWILLFLLEPLGAIGYLILGIINWGVWPTLGWTALGIFALFVAVVIGSLFTPSNSHWVTDYIGGPSFVSRSPTRAGIIQGVIIGAIIFLAIVLGAAYLIA